MVIIVGADLRAAPFASQPMRPEGAIVLQPRATPWVMTVRRSLRPVRATVNSQPLDAVIVALTGRRCVVDYATQGAVSALTLRDSALGWTKVALSARSECATCCLLSSEDARPPKIAPLFNGRASEMRAYYDLPPTCYPSLFIGRASEMRAYYDYHCELRILCRDKTSTAYNFTAEMSTRLLTMA